MKPRGITCSPRDPGAWQYPVRKRGILGGGLDIAEGMEPGGYGGVTHGPLGTAAWPLVLGLV